MARERQNRCTTAEDHEEARQDLRGAPRNPLRHKLLRGESDWSPAGGRGTIANSLVDGARMLTSIINDPEVGARTKLQAIDLLVNRVIGKPHESVALDITADGGAPGWQKVFAQGIAAAAGIVASVDEIPQESDAADVVEGEAVEEGEGHG